MSSNLKRNGTSIIRKKKAACFSEPSSLLVDLVPLKSSLDVQMESERHIYTICKTDPTIMKNNHCSINQLGDPSQVSGHSRQVQIIYSSHVKERQVWSLHEQNGNAQLYVAVLICTGLPWQYSAKAGKVRDSSIFKLKSGNDGKWEKLESAWPAEAGGMGRWVAWNNRGRSDGTF